LKGHLSTNGDSPALEALLKNRRDLLDKLQKASTWDERVTIYLDYRKRGILPGLAGFFLVAHAIDVIASDEKIEAMDREPLKGIDLRIEAIKKSHGLQDDEEWGIGAGPADYLALVAEWEQFSNQLHADVFRRFGEHEMADLFLNDREEFHRRYEEGWKEMHEEKPEQDPAEEGEL
jgi:hypothetical protein